MPLKIHYKAEQLVDAVGPILEPLRRRSRDLADQIERATTSVQLNIAEGEYLKAGKQRHHFELAAGSCNETRAALRIALAWRYVDPDIVRPAYGIADELCRMLWRITH